MPGYDDLMREVCVVLGFCGSSKGGQPTHVDDYVPESGCVTAEQFVDWVLLAEGLNPVHSSYRRAIRDAFVRHMGGDAVDARLPEWACIRGD